MRLRDRHCYGWVHFIVTKKVRFWGLRNTVFFVFNTVIIVISFVRGQNCIFVIDIVTCECALFILIKVWLRVFHHCYCLLIYDKSVISFLIFLLTNGTMERWWMVIWCNGEINNRLVISFLTNIESVYLFYFLTQNFRWSLRTKKLW